jgi:hypothetical protein
MPKVYEYLGLIFFFYANEHLPSGELKEAVKFVKKYHKGIVDKWTDFFVKNKKVKCEVIKKKIK